MIVTEPFSRSYPAIVSGMRSPSASARRMMNWPGFAFFAMSGASISIRVTVGFSASFFRIVYITLKTFLSVLLFLSLRRIFKRRILQKTQERL